MTAINVLVTCGAPLVQEAVAAALACRSNINLVGNADGHEEALELMASHRVDVVLIEASQDRNRALEVVRRVRDVFPEIEILPVGVGDVEDIVLLAEAGANGYLQSSGLVSDLLSTIEALHNKQTPCSPEVASSVFSRISELARECEAGEPAAESTIEDQLSPRELEILEQAARGLSNQEIAHQLQISLSTVKNHMHRVLVKLGASSRREAVAKAFRLGIIDDPLPSVRVAQSG